MGEHITGFLNVHVRSDNSTPKGKETKVIITVTGELTPDRMEELIAAFEKAGNDFGMDVQKSRK